MPNLRSLPYMFAAALILAGAGEACAEWRYTCPKCGRDLGPAVGSGPTSCGCGWRYGDHVSKGGGIDPCLLGSCMGVIVLFGGAGFLAFLFLPKLLAAKPRKPRRRRRLEEDF